MFNLVQGRRTYFLFSALVISVGFAVMIYSLITNGSVFPLGVDFRGGTRFELQFTEPVQEEDIEAVFNDFGIGNVSVIALEGEQLQNAWQIRTETVTPETAQAIEAALSDNLAPLVPQTTQVQSVSAIVASEVTNAAITAVFTAAIIILIYIVIAFRQVPNPIRYGACAVIAMIHDLLIIFGFASITGLLLGWEVDVLFLTAVLTVAGFSLQDTIIVFDRIRENKTKRPLEDYEVTVNRSVLETIHRSLATQMNALFVLTAILFFGGASIKPFVAVLLVGLLSGQYSSIFTAVPLLVAWEKNEIPLLRA